MNTNEEVTLRGFVLRGLKPLLCQRTLRRAAVVSEQSVKIYKCYAMSANTFMKIIHMWEDCEKVEA